MDLVMYFILSAVYCSLVITQNNAHEKLPKPTLEIEADDPNDVSMIGGTVYLNCRNSSTAQRFYVRKEGNNDSIADQLTSEFTIRNLRHIDSGLYSCQYRMNSEYSERSDPLYLYVSDRYPPPTITAEPHSIIQPGKEVTIRCTSPYPNIVFTLFKGDDEIKKNDNNPFTYVIHNADTEHAGQYSCRFTKLGMESHFSDPLMIDVKVLPRPSITWENYRGGQLKISCMAPENNTRMWFQLFNESKDVIDEIKAIKENQVDFIMPYPEQSYSNYYCMYRIRMGGNFADSLISDAAVIMEDYTKQNIIRLLLSTIILILLTAIVVKHFKWKSHHPSLPVHWTKLAVESDYTKMEVMKSQEEEEENTAAAVQIDYSEESSPDKEKAKEVTWMKDDDSVEKSSGQTPATIVYAVIEKSKDQEEQNTFI